MAENMNVSTVVPSPSQGQPGAAGAPVAQRPQVQEAPAQSTTETAQAVTESAKVSVEQLQAAIEKLNEFMRDGQRALAFSVDESANELIVQVRDRETDELVRQIPSREALELKQHLEGVIGLLFNDSV